MIKVLFVCHGNICRSPMAEFILKDMVKKLGIADRFEIKSAATSTEEIWNGVGNSVYPPARKELAKHGIRCDGKRAVQLKASHGIRCDGKRAVQLKASDYDYYDYLIGMDSMNMRNMERMIGHRAGEKMKLLLEYAGENRGITDPWYSGRFDVTYEDVVTGCKAFLEYLKRENKI